MNCKLLMLLVYVIGKSSADLFSSLEEFRVVPIAQKQIASELKTYVKAEKERLQQIKKFADEFESESMQNGDDVVNIISNPINAYHMAKRFYHRQSRFEDLINNSELVKAALDRLGQYRKHLPSKEDYDGSVTALLRLQDTYELSPSVLANNLLPEALNSSRLSALDCFEIGRAAYWSQDYYHAVSWMQEAYDRLRVEPGTSNVDKVALLDYLSYAFYLQGNLKRALQLAEELLTIQPDHERATKGKAYYAYHLKNVSAETLNQQDALENKQKLLGYHSSEEYKIYQRLCRGEDIKRIKNPHKLYCDYARNNDPRLLIAPLKRETVHLDPWIMVYYDAISEKESQFFKNEAFNRLQRPIFPDGANGTTTNVKFRITKTAWLRNDTDKVITPRILSRLSAMTQINLEYAEEFQVANYGIGGHYEPHFDYTQGDILGLKSENGNRIATALFYMSDVPSGGSTVFPYLGVEVKPVKGSVAFWFNLNKSGEGDQLTRHAACPVVVGNKWVVNKWYHERGNEFWLPCGTKREDRYAPFDFEQAKPTFQRNHGRLTFNKI